MRARGWVFLGLAALPSLPAGCGGGGGSNAPTPAVTPSPLSLSALTPDGLTATLTEDRATVPVGGSVSYTFTLTNHTSQPITYLTVSSDNGPVEATSNSIQISNTAGDTTFSAGALLGPPQDGPSFTLAPGASSPGGIDVEPGAFPTAGAYAATAVFRLRAAPGAAVQTTTVGSLAVIAQ